MHIIAHIDHYGLPPIGHVDGILIYPDGDPRTVPTSQPMLIKEVGREDMQLLREKPQEGVPLWACLCLDDDGALTLWLYPCPARDTVLRLRYFPPMVEI